VPRPLHPADFLRRARPAAIAACAGNIVQNFSYTMTFLRQAQDGNEPSRAAANANLL
jgi:hypothetical protein